MRACSLFPLTRSFGAEAGAARYEIKYSPVSPSYVLSVSFPAQSAFAQRKGMESSPSLLIYFPLISSFPLSVVLHRHVAHYASFKYNYSRSGLSFTPLCCTTGGVETRFVPGFCDE